MWPTPFGQRSPSSTPLKYHNIKLHNTLFEFLDEVKLKNLRINQSVQVIYAIILARYLIVKSTMDHRNLALNFVDPDLNFTAPNLTSMDLNPTLSFMDPTRIFNTIPMDQILNQIDQNCREVAQWQIYANKVSYLNQEGKKKLQEY